MTDSAFNVAHALWSDGESSSLDSSGPSVFRSVSPSRRHRATKARAAAAAFAWRHPNSNLTACHVCDWIKDIEEERWLLKLLWEIMRDLMRGSSLRCNWQTGTLHGEKEDVPHSGVPRYIWQPLVKPSILIPAVTKTRLQPLPYAKVKTNLRRVRGTKHTKKLLEKILNNWKVNSHTLYFLFNTSWRHCF